VIDHADITDLCSNAGPARARDIRSPADTSEDAQRVRLDILHHISFEQKAAQMSELSETLRDSMIAGVRFRHPEYAPGEARWAVVRHLLGDDLFATAFPDAPCIPHMLVGSFASGFHGEFRATQDADVVIDPTLE